MRVILTGLCGVTLAWAALPASADMMSYCEAYARNQADKHLSGGGVLGSTPKLTASERDKRKMLALADCLMLYTPKPVIKTVKAQPEPQSDESEPAKAIPVATPREKPKIMAKPVIEALTVKTKPQPESETVTPIPIATPRAKPKTIVPPKQKTPTTVAKIEAATAIAPTQKKKSVTNSASLVAGTKNYCAAKYASYKPATGTYTTHSGKQRRCLATDSKAPVRVIRTQLPAPRTKSKLPTQAAKSQPLPVAAKEKSVWDSFDNPGLPISR